MKIVVYAICKNESKFVQRWMESMSEADQVVVLDTGSTDETPQLLRSQGALVTVEAIAPWRFDVARNRSLELVSEDTDICVCTDLAKRAGNSLDSGNWPGPLSLYLVFLSGRVGGCGLLVREDPSQTRLPLDPSGP